MKVKVFSVIEGRLANDKEVLEMRKVDQKKILVLGGTKHMIGVVETVKRMGVASIVVDNVSGSPAKSYADKSFNVSISDIQGLVEIIRQEKVDGIFTAFEDLNIWNAVALCKKTNLPFYATGESMAITMDKDKFKEICRRFDVPVIEEKGLSADMDQTAIATWEFPVMIKKVVHSKSKDIRIYYNS